MRTTAADSTFSDALDRASRWLKKKLGKSKSKAKSEKGVKQAIPVEGLPPASQAADGEADLGITTGDEPGTTTSAFPQDFVAAAGQDSIGGSSKPVAQSLRYRAAPQANAPDNMGVGFARGSSASQQAPAPVLILGPQGAIFAAGHSSQSAVSSAQQALGSRPQSGEGLASGSRSLDVRMVSEPFLSQSLEVKLLAQRASVPGKGRKGGVPVVSLRTLQQHIGNTDLALVVARVATLGQGSEYTSRSRHTSRELPPVCAAAQKLASAKSARGERGGSSSRRQAQGSFTKDSKLRRACTSGNLELTGQRASLMGLGVPGDQGRQHGANRDSSGSKGRRASDVLQELRAIAAQQRKSQDPPSGGEGAANGNGALKHNSKPELPATAGVQRLSGEDPGAGTPRTAGAAPALSSLGSGLNLSELLTASLTEVLKSSTRGGAPRVGGATAPSSQRPPRPRLSNAGSSSLQRREGGKDNNTSGEEQRHESGDDKGMGLTGLLGSEASITALESLIRAHGEGGSSRGGKQLSKALSPSGGSTGALGSSTLQLLNAVRIANMSNQSTRQFPEDTGGLAGAAAGASTNSMPLRPSQESMYRKESTASSRQVQTAAPPSPLSRGATGASIPNTPRAHPMLGAQPVASATPGHPQHHISGSSMRSKKRWAATLQEGMAKAFSSPNLRGMAAVMPSLRVRARPRYDTRNEPSHRQSTGGTRAGSGEEIPVASGSLLSPEVSQDLGDGMSAAMTGLSGLSGVSSHTGMSGTAAGVAGSNAAISGIALSRALTGASGLSSSTLAGTLAPVNETGGSGRIHSIPLSRGSRAGGTSSNTSTHQLQDQPSEEGGSSGKGGRHASVTFKLSSFGRRSRRSRNANLDTASSQQGDSAKRASADGRPSPATAAFRRWQTTINQSSTTPPPMRRTYAGAGVGLGDSASPSPRTSFDDARTSGRSTAQTGFTTVTHQTAGDTSTNLGTGTVATGAPGTSSEELGVETVAGRLEPVYINDAAQALLRVSSLTECLRLLDAQMGKDPSLMLVLEEAVRMGMEGRAGVLTHYLPAHTSTGIQRPGNQDLRTWGMSRKSLEANGPGGFVQVQIMTVSLALSDYQLEPALFLHYRSVGWLGMGPGVMVRPSLEAFTKHLTATGGVMLQVTGSMSVSNAGAGEAGVNNTGTLGLSGPWGNTSPGPLIAQDTKTAGLSMTSASGHPTPGTRSSVLSLGGWQKDNTGSPKHQTIPETGAAAPGTEQGDTVPPLRLSAEFNAPERPSRTSLPPVRAATPDATVSAQMTASLQLMYSALSHAPVMVMILAMDGRILWQNGRSVDYCGLVYTQVYQYSRTLTDRAHTLNRLFSKDESALENMLSAVNSGQLWSGLVRMPAYLDLSEDYLPSTQSQVEGLGVSSTTWRPSPRGGLRLNAAPSAGALNEWALEVLGEVNELSDSVSASPAAVLAHSGSRAQGLSPQVTNVSKAPSYISLAGLDNEAHASSGTQHTAGGGRHTGGSKHSAHSASAAWLAAHHNSTNNLLHHQQQHSPQQHSSAHRNSQGKSFERAFRSQGSSELTGHMPPGVGAGSHGGGLHDLTFPSSGPLLKSSSLHHNPVYVHTPSTRLATSTSGASTCSPPTPGPSRLSQNGGPSASLSPVTPGVTSPPGAAGLSGGGSHLGEKASGPLYRVDVVIEEEEGNSGGLGASKLQEQPSPSGAGVTYYTAAGNSTSERSSPDAVGQDESGYAPPGATGGLLAHTASGGQSVGVRGSGGSVSARISAVAPHLHGGSRRPSMAASVKLTSEMVLGPDGLTEISDSRRTSMAVEPQYHSAGLEKVMAWQQAGSRAQAWSNAGGYANPLASDSAGQVYLGHNGTENPSAAEHMLEGTMHTAEEALSGQLGIRRTAGRAHSFASMRLRTIASLQLEGTAGNLAGMRPSLDMAVPTRVDSGLMDSSVLRGGAVAGPVGSGRTAATTPPASMTPLGPNDRGPLNALHLHGSFSRNSLDMRTPPGAMSPAGRASIDVGAGGGVYARQLWAGAVGSISRRSRLLSTPQATRQYRAQPEAGLEGTARALRLVMDARTSAASLAGTGSGGGALQGGPGGTPGGGASNSPSAAQVALPGLVVRIGPSNPGGGPALSHMGSFTRRSLHLPTMSAGLPQGDGSGGWSGALTPGAMSAPGDVPQPLSLGLDEPAMPDTPGNPQQGATAGGGATQRQSEAGRDSSGRQRSSLSKVSTAQTQHSSSGAQPAAKEAGGAPRQQVRHSPQHKRAASEPVSPPAAAPGTPSAHAAGSFAPHVSESSILEAQSVPSGAGLVTSDGSLHVLDGSGGASTPPHMTVHVEAIGGVQQTPEEAGLAVASSETSSPTACKAGATEADTEGHLAFAGFSGCQDTAPLSPLPLVTAIAAPAHGNAAAASTTPAPTAAFPNAATAEAANVAAAAATLLQHSTSRREISAYPLVLGPHLAATSSLYSSPSWSPAITQQQPRGRPAGGAAGGGASHPVAGQREDSSTGARGITEEDILVEGLEAIRTCSKDSCIPLGISSTQQTGEAALLLGSQQHSPRITSTLPTDPAPQVPGVTHSSSQAVDTEGVSSLGQAEAVQPASTAPPVARSTSPTSLSSPFRQSSGEHDPPAARRARSGSLGSDRQAPLHPQQQQGRLMSRLGPVSSGSEGRAPQPARSSTSTTPAPCSARTSGDDAHNQQLQQQRPQGGDGMAAAGGADPAGVVGLQQQGSFTEQEGLSDGVSGMMHGSGAESDEREMFERQMSSAVAAAEDFLWFDIEAHAIPSPVTGQKILMLVSYDVSQYVNAELEVKRVLDVEHRLLEEVFPRHVLEIMAARSASAPHPFHPQPSVVSEGLTEATSVAGHGSAHPLLARQASAGVGALAGYPVSQSHHLTRLQSQNSGMLQKQSQTFSSDATVLRRQTSSMNVSMEIDPAAAAAVAAGATGTTTPIPIPPQSGPLPHVTMDGRPGTSPAGNGAQGMASAGSSSGPIAAGLMMRAPLPRLPSAVPAASNLQADLARSHSMVSILFADIAGFTNMCSQLPPATVMTFLNGLFTAFDELVELHGVYKVETIGDSYMVCGGLVSKDAEGFTSVIEDCDPFHAKKVFELAVDMLATAAMTPMPTGDGSHVQLRVGIHSGPVTSGVVGRKMPRFCLFGDTVNTASRMESTGRPMAVQVSETTWTALQGTGWEGDPRWQSHIAHAKGKGELSTWVWSEHHL